MSPTKLQLTNERRDIITAATAEWLKVGLSTEPADFDAAEDAITKLYAAVDKQKPYFVRRSSPKGAELYINRLCKTWPEVFNDSQLGSQLDSQLLGQLDSQLFGHLDSQLLGQLDSQLFGQLYRQLGRPPYRQLDSQLRSPEEPLKYMGTWFWGSQDAYLWGYYEAGRRVGAVYTPSINDILSDYCAVTRSVDWWYPFFDFCIITDRPQIIALDAENRLHSEVGPSISYRDGWSLWHSHGVPTPQYVIERPSEITVEKIDAESNAEVRRVMVERYKLGEEVPGAGAYMRDAGAERLDYDAGCGTLWRRQVPDDEPIVMIEVINSTPELDGHFKTYFLRVPPTMRKAHEAVAWTFGMTADQYRPRVES